MGYFKTYLQICMLFFSSGIEAQKVSVINNLPSLFQNNANDAIKKVMPLVRVCFVQVHID